MLPAVGGDRSAGDRILVNVRADAEHWSFRAALVGSNEISLLLCDEAKQHCAPCDAAESLRTLGDRVIRHFHEVSHRPSSKTKFLTDCSTPHGARKTPKFFSLTMILTQSQFFLNHSIACKLNVFRILRGITASMFLIQHVSNSLLTSLV